MPQQYIQTLVVFYGTEPSQEPSNAIQELFNHSPDCNHGFDGKYVWLIPVYTTNLAQAATSFTIAIQHQAGNDHFDLAKDSNSSNRYLIAHKNEDSDKIVEVCLWRSNNRQSVPPEGWHGMAKDINRHRGKTHLYIAWRYE